MAYTTKPNNKKEQLCWYCKRAVNCEPLNCPWAALGKPIEGWEATKIVRRDRLANDIKMITTYQITSCPLFVQDRKEAVDVMTLWQNGKTWWQNDD